MPGTDAAAGWGGGVVGTAWRGLEAALLVCACWGRFGSVRDQAAILLNMSAVLLHVLRHLCGVSSLGACGINFDNTMDTLICKEIFTV
jgi:hypothetical protein